MTFSYVDSPEKLSHSYIISRGSEKERLDTAKRIASAAVCVSDGQRPCGHCRACRKAQSDMHPDITVINRIVDDKGKTKKFVSVDQIRGMRDDSLVMPNESDYKVYVIAEGEKLNTEAQNAALKILEEPPAGVIIIICTDNEANLLVTVRSRCTLLRCSGSADLEEPDDKKTEEYFKALASRSALALPDWCVSNEKQSPEDFDELAESIETAAVDMLAGRRENPGLDTKTLIRVYGLMQRLKSMRRVNVGPKTLMGLMMTDSLPPDE